MKPIAKVGLIIIFICIIGLVLASPFAQNGFSPYRQTDNILTVEAGEKVQFDGIYVGITSWGSDDVLYYVPPTNYDVIQVGQEYVILSDDYSSHDLFGNEGKRVHLEGAFESSHATSQPFNDTVIDAYVFSPDRIEIIS